MHPSINGVQALLSHWENHKKSALHLPQYLLHLSCTMSFLSLNPWLDIPLARCSEAAAVMQCRGRGSVKEVSYRKRSTLNANSGYMCTKLRVAGLPSAPAVIRFSERHRVLVYGRQKNSFWKNQAEREVSQKIPIFVHRKEKMELGWSHYRNHLKLSSSYKHASIIHHKRKTCN